MSFAVVQGVFQLFDKWRSLTYRKEDKRWFEEDATWHEEDVAKRNSEYSAHLSGKKMRKIVRDWHVEIAEQRNLENARVLWLRFVEKNRRDVEEKSELLKAIQQIGALFSGLAHVALTQLVVIPPGSENGPPFDPLVAIIPYAVLTAGVLGSLCVSVVICSMLLGVILRGGKNYVSEAAEEEFIIACRDFCHGYSAGDRPPSPRLTFDYFWASKCESTWQLAFGLFQLGATMFLFSLIPTGWMVFIKYDSARWGFLTLIGVTCVCWMFVQITWGRYLRKRSVNHEADKIAGQAAGLPYDWHAAPKRDDTWDHT